MPFVNLVRFAVPFSNDDHKFDGDIMAEVEERLKQLESDLDQIKQRNIRVEADKAWETSPYRIGSICAITYATAVALLYAINADRPFLGALMPVVGFFLSTLSLPAIKRWWIKSTWKDPS
jgi:hypothetical protein